MYIRLGNENGHRLFSYETKNKLLNALEKYNSYPAISLPQYQIFTPDRYQIKTRLCILFNKKI